MLGLELLALAPISTQALSGWSMPWTLPHRPCRCNQGLSPS